MPQITQPGPLEDLEYLGGWFTVEIKGLTVAAFTKVGGLSLEVSVVPMEDSNKRTSSRKTPGVAKYGELTLERMLTGDKTFWTWAKSIRDGAKAFRKDGSVVIFDISSAEVGRWSFQNAWPMKWSASDLDVGSDDPMQESITLAIEFLQRIK